MVPVVEAGSRPDSELDEKDGILPVDLEADRRTSPETQILSRKQRLAVTGMFEPEKLPKDWPAKARAKAEWLPSALLAPDTLNLFFDLVAVAVLTNFSSNKELFSASAIGAFFSFFALFWCACMTHRTWKVR